MFAYNLEGNMFVSVVLLLATGISHLKLIFMTCWLSGEHNNYVLVASVFHFFDDRMASDIPWYCNCGVLQTEGSLSQGTVRRSLRVKTRETQIHPYPVPARRLFRPFSVTYPRRMGKNSLGLRDPKRIGRAE